MTLYALIIIILMMIYLTVALNRLKRRTEEFAEEVRAVIGFFLIREEVPLFGEDPESAKFVGPIREQGDRYDRKTG